MECRTGITSASKVTVLLLSLSHLENMKKIRFSKKAHATTIWDKKIVINFFILHITSNATGTLLHLLHARDLPYLRDQASLTSAQLVKVHIATVLVLTFPYLLLLQTKEQMEKD
jgi:hypothetical protein